MLKTKSRLFRSPFSGLCDNPGPVVVAWGKKHSQNLALNLNTGNHSKSCSLFQLLQLCNAVNCWHTPLIQKCMGFVLTPRLVWSVKQSQNHLLYFLAICISKLFGREARCELALLTSQPDSPPLLPGPWKLPASCQTSLSVKTRMTTLNIPIS